MFKHPRSGVLKTILNRCRDFLADRLELDVKAHPCVNRTNHGMDFLGSRIKPDHVTLNRRSRTRFLRKMVRLEAQFERREVKKEYHALVAGRVEWKRLEVREPIQVSNTGVGISSKGKERYDIIDISHDIKI